MLSEINFFSIGSSKDISTFSGVPFFFSRELEKRGIIVNRIDLSPPPFINKWFNRIVRRCVLLFNKQSSYDFSRSILFDLYKRWKIWRANCHYPTAQCSLFITYCAHNFKENHINVLFGDWTLQYWLESHESTDCLEERYISRENRYIQKADLTLSLFPLSAAYIQSKVPQAHVLHLGTNVVNDFNEHHLSEQQILSKKIQKKSILFIGRGYYLEGLKLLLDAYKVLRLKYNDIEIDVIGLTKEDTEVSISDIPCGVNFHGFLRKSLQAECELYYNLLNKASLFVNPTPKWAGYSSMIEAMYYYTPIITSPYNEFVQEFGNNIRFGKYLMEGGSLAYTIDEILSEDENAYIGRCKTAHESVKDHTWEQYVEAFIDKVSQIKK